MYLDFYGFHEGPFRQTPNPKFLFLGERHREALAQLEYGIRERSGFLVLTGEVGTGKTTLLRSLLERLDSSTETALVFHTLLGFDEILAYALEDFGVVCPGATNAERLMALNRFLTERRRAGLDTVLVIDEAQNLSKDALEGIRLLSNFETATEKLLQIVLIGQPELERTLAAPELRQLRQRISIRAEIGALTATESLEYIRHRLRTARGLQHGASPREKGFEPFTIGAAKRIAAYAQGIPRMMNLVCEHALILGYADQRRLIDRRHVRPAIRAISRLEGLPTVRQGWFGRIFSSS